MPQLSFYLNASPALRGLMDQTIRLMETERAFRAIAPRTLAKHCRVAGLERGVLTLATDNGAIAAKLKQQQPSLLLRLRAQGLKVTSLRVQVRPLQRARTTPKGATLGPGAISALQDLARNLDDSPLKKAVLAMIAGHLDRNKVTSS